jgi:hypothetical protein
VGHHRFSAEFEIILEEPGNKNTSDPDPMPDDLLQNLITQIKQATPEDAKGKKYKVEKAAKAKKKS